MFSDFSFSEYLNFANSILEKTTLGIPVFNSKSFKNFSLGFD